MAHEAHQDGSIWLQEESPEGPKTQKTMIFLRLFIGFWILTFPGFRQLKTAQQAPKIAPRRPKRPQEGPRELQNEPRSVQDSEKVQKGI